MNTKKVTWGLVAIVLGIIAFSSILLMRCNKKIDIGTILPTGEEMPIIKLSEDTQTIFCKLLDLKFTLLSVVAFILIGTGLPLLIKGLANER